LKGLRETIYEKERRRSGAYVGGVWGKKPSHWHLGGNFEGGKKKIGSGEEK